MPRVSIIIPSYNTATLIGESLDSIFAQDYTDFEIIVINDGSPDTPELERVLEPYRDRIVYLKQENRRACGARNNGIRHAQGEYLAFLDSDDSWTPTYLREQMRHLDGNPALDMIYCDCLIYGDGPQAGTTFMQVCPSHGPVSFESLIQERSQIPISGVIVRRETLMKAGFFDERLPMCDDYEMWLRLAYHGARIDYHKAVLSRLRIGRPASLSSSNSRMIEALIRILSLVKTEWKITAEQRALLQTKLDETQALLALERGKESLDRGEFDKARTLFEEANQNLKRTKLSLTVLGLRIAPALTAHFARRWERMRLGQPVRAAAH